MRHVSAVLYVQSLLRISHDVGSNTGPSGGEGGREEAGDPLTNGDGDQRYAVGSGGGNFTEVEECLWLRVFGAVELHAQPRRTEPGQGPTSPDLVPVDKAIAAVENIFGPGSSTSGGGSFSSAAMTPRKRKSAGGRCA